MSAQPWYRTTARWGQVNLVEIDPTRYDDAWWRSQWKRTRVQGVIVNAGGIVAYYPTSFPLQYRAKALDDRDLYGDIVRSARAEGLKVIARMDSSRVAQNFLDAHPDWITRDRHGNPYQVQDKFVTCINSPYYTEYLPAIMREIITRSGPDGLSDNSWPGMSREHICYCQHCKREFKAETGEDLPETHDWSDEVYRQWIRWSYTVRSGLFAFNNAVTKEAGGEHCVWSGMIGGDLSYNCERFVDVKEVLAQAEIVMLDHQRRNLAEGFAGNTEAGKRLHELAGAHKLVPESMPLYQTGAPVFRLATMPPAEVRLWSSSAFAGGIQPWWHHIGSAHDDRRQYFTAEPIFRWHEANEDILTNRAPVADVGVVWSQENHDFHGQDRSLERTLNPYRGVVKALDRAGITWIPVNADHIARDAHRFGVLILPNVAAMSDAQVKAVEAYSAAGGSVIATSETSLQELYGKSRPDPALGALFGIKMAGCSIGGRGMADTDIEVSDRHTYLRLSPELRGSVDGPKDDTAPAADCVRHPILRGLEKTDIIPFGGYLRGVSTAPDVTVLATLVPDFPIYPPETAWMRVPRTDIPGITVRETPSGGKLVWFVADIDRCFARDENVEHGMLIANAVRWCVGERTHVALEGGLGHISVSMYSQGHRDIIHLNNRISTSRVGGRQHDLIPVRSIRVAVRARPGCKSPSNVSLRVQGMSVPATVTDTGIAFDVAEVLDHEVAVIDWSA